MNHSSLHRFLAIAAWLCLIYCFSPWSASAQEGAEAEPAEITSEADSQSGEPKSSLLAVFNSAVFRILFFDASFGAFRVAEVNEDGSPVLDESGSPSVKVVELPFLVIVLLLGGIFFTIWYRWINIRGFKHSLKVISGKYDRPEDTGEISHFRALTSALSATIGLGNIAGVAVAIQLGGPGAVFWMWITAVFGMTSKFSSCTLAQLYRKVNSDGSISGGPMYYLDLGLQEKGPLWGVLGKILAVMFAFMVMGGAIGGGNMFQANQTVEAITDTFRLDAELAMSADEYQQWIRNHAQHSEIIETIRADVGGEVHLHLRDLDQDQRAALGETLAELKDDAAAGAKLGIGIALAVFAGVVILGGIKRIGAATSRIVPLMCGLYILASMFVIITNITELPNALGLIFKMAFTQNAFYGGMAGVLVWGIKRAAFSNEAGLGSAAIAHAAAKTDEPVREGIVAMIGPFIDTIVVCTMTALVVIITGAWNDPSIPQSAGVTLTTAAFGKAIEWFPYVLTGCIALFAYSTMISWCYYGERGWIYLLDHLGGMGLKTVHVFRVIFVLCIIMGAIYPLRDVLDFSDAMILSMAFPNILGSIILAPTVLRRVRDYWSRYTSGEMKPVR
jgi:AGCS family alanine or glycine:cation symporter